LVADGACPARADLIDNRMPATSPTTRRLPDDSDPGALPRAHELLSRAAGGTRMRIITVFLGAAILLGNTLAQADARPTRDAQAALLGRHDRLERAGEQVVPSRSSRWLGLSPSWTSGIASWGASQIHHFALGRTRTREVSVTYEGRRGMTKSDITKRVDTASGPTVSRIRIYRWPSGHRLFTVSSGHGVRSQLVDPNEAVREVRSGELKSIFARLGRFERVQTPLTARLDDALMPDRAPKTLGDALARGVHLRVERLRGKVTDLLR
jgi:hypothetical protein